jgi:ubiquinone/menaquinone biosynthesis C-methylase UbiE
MQRAQRTKRMSEQTTGESWDPEWENIHSKEQLGRYPSEHLIRVMAHHFYGVPNRKDIKILEVGSGQGAQIWYLSREGFSTYGVEGSKTAIESCQKRLKAENLKADIQKGDIINLDYPENFFDCVIDMECLTTNSFQNTQHIIKEIHRVLKKDGIFFSQTFSTNTYIGDDFQEIEKNTYKNIGNGNLARKRLIRFTGEDQIKELYSGFSKMDYEVAAVTQQNLNEKYEEFLVLCTK